MDEENENKNVIDDENLFSVLYPDDRVNIRQWIETFSDSQVNVCVSRETKTLQVRATIGSNEKIKMISYVTFHSKAHRAFYCRNEICEFWIDGSKWVEAYKAGRKTNMLHTLHLVGDQLQVRTESMSDQKQTQQKMTCLISSPISQQLQQSHSQLHSQLQQGPSTMIPVDLVPCHSLSQSQSQNISQTLTPNKEQQQQPSSLASMVSMVSTQPTTSLLYSSFCIPAQLHSQLLNLSEPYSFITLPTKQLKSICLHLGIFGSLCDEFPGSFHTATFDLCPESLTITVKENYRGKAMTRILPHQEDGKDDVIIRFAEDHPKRFTQNHFLYCVYLFCRSQHPVSDYMTIAFAPNKTLVLLADIKDIASKIFHLFPIP